MHRNFALLAQSARALCSSFALLLARLCIEVVHCWHAVHCALVLLLCWHTVHCALGGFPELASPLPSPLGKAFCREQELENWTWTYLPSMLCYSLWCFKKTLLGNWVKYKRAIFAKRMPLTDRKIGSVQGDLNQCYFPDFRDFCAAVPPVTS